MQQSTTRLTDAQHEMVGDLDDVAEHVAWEFDADEYQGMSTCGMASITNIDGRSSFVRRVKSLATSDAVDWIRNAGRPDVDKYVIEIGSLDLLLTHSEYHGCYRLSLTNIGEIMGGPEMQRMDVQERLHDLVLERLRYRGYLDDARRTSRMD